MPRLRDDTRAQRRHAILVSAWGCFSRNGFHATSMDDIIAAHGTSASAVYRYFRSKDELIDATAEEGLARVRDVFVKILAVDPTPGPTETITVLVGELQQRTTHPDYDLTRLALQTWAEALRRPPLRARTRALYGEARDHIAELTSRWKADGHLPDDADPQAAASVLFAVMHGLIVCHHLVADVPAEQIGHGLSALASAFSAEQIPPILPAE